MTPAGFYGASGPGHRALVSLFGNYTQENWSSIVLGVIRRDREGKSSEKSSTYPSHPQVRERQKREAEGSNVGMPQSFLLRKCCRPRWSGASIYERRVVSPLQAQENERKKA